MMKLDKFFSIIKNKIALIIELVLIFTYSFMILFSIVFMPINIILGIICILVLPGYNLLNLIKPQFNLIEKLGYMTILSLAIENLLMFFNYMTLYDIVTTPENPEFFFNTTLLITTIQFINIILIFAKYFQKNDKNKIKKLNLLINFDYVREKINVKIFLIYISFILSLILLCISALYSDVSNNEFAVNYQEYKSNFTFFNRVPSIFYIFLAISILCFVIIIFFTKNRYFILFSISAFVYCLSILPYLQIGNYFGSDSYFLWLSYNNYLDYGIGTLSDYNFVIKSEIPTIFRYSTSLFTTILLTSGTSTDINIALWYLFPLIYISLPFFFYSVFQKFSNNKKKNNLMLTILTILAILTSQFSKSIHSATTGSMGVIIFFILTLEFFNLINAKEVKDKKIDIFLIFFLFFFLCLTHFEECIYFLILIIIYSIYYSFFKIKEIGIDEFFIFKNQEELKDKYGWEKILLFIGSKAKDYSYQNLIEILPEILKIDKDINFIIVGDYLYKNDVLNFIEKNRLNKQIHFLGIKNHEEILRTKNLKKTIMMMGLLLFILSLTFYIIQEFFGLISYYYFQIFGNGIDNIIYILYENSKVINLPVLRGTFNFSIFFIGIMFLGALIFIIFCYLSCFKFYSFFLKIYNIIITYLKKIHKILIKLISTKVFRVLLFPISFGGIIILNSIYYPFLEERGLFLIIELILSYTILIFHMFLFFMGIKYYKIVNHKQNYFLLAIIASSSIMGLLFIIGNRELAFYLLNSRFPTFFIFFNLMIIENTYFKDFMSKKKIFLILTIFLLLIFGTFCSLRKLAWG